MGQGILGAAQINAQRIDRRLVAGHVGAHGVRAVRCNRIGARCADQAHIGEIVHRQTAIVFPS